MDAFDPTSPRRYVCGCGSWRTLRDLKTASPEAAADLDAAQLDLIGWVSVGGRWVCCACSGHIRQEHAMAENARRRAAAAEKRRKDAERITGAGGDDEDEFDDGSGEDWKKPGGV